MRETSLMLIPGPLATVQGRMDLGSVKLGSSKFIINLIDQVFDCGAVLHLKLGNPQVIQKTY